MEKLPNIHPGEILKTEFLVPLGISAYKLAKDIDIPQTRISAILKEKRRITADTALRLGQYFGNSAKFWLGLQNDFDIEEQRRKKALAIETIEPYSIEKAG
jgi:addiction module HigA family antidote